MKVIKVKKAGWIALLGIVAFFVSKYMAAHKQPYSTLVLQFSGLLLIIGGLLFLYPIFLSKKDGKGNVRIITDIKLDDEEKKDQKTDGQSG